MEKKYDSRLNRDRKLGNFISMNLTKDAGVGNCPSLEEIAALIDGKLEGSDKDTTMAHLAVCPDCYEIFSRTSKDVLSLSESWRHTLTRMTTPALALAASVLLVVRIFFYSPAMNLPYSHEMIGQLTSVLETSDLKPDVIARGPGSSGLAEALGLLTQEQQQSFLFGFYIAHLELTITGKKPEQGQEQLLELGKILQWEKRADVAGSFKQLEGFLANKKFPEASEELYVLQKRIAAEMKEEAISSFYHLGMWCSIGHAVLESGNKEAIEILLFNREQLKAMNALLKEQNAPQEILEEVAAITVVTEREVLGEVDYRDILTHVQKIVNYLMI